MSGITAPIQDRNPIRKNHRIKKGIKGFSLAVSKLLKVGAVKQKIAEFVKIAMIEVALRIVSQVPMSFAAYGWGLR